MCVALGWLVSLFSSHRAALLLCRYYIMQLVVDGGQGGYYLWCRWGRTGTSGSGQLTGPLQDPDDAVEAFDKVYVRSVSERDGALPCPLLHLPASLYLLKQRNATQRNANQPLLPQIAESKKKKHLFFRLRPGTSPKQATAGTIAKLVARQKARSMPTWQLQRPATNPRFGST